MMLRPLAFLLVLLPMFAFADTFTVTTNADSGPGSLRDALQQAADNGTVVRDSIIFTLPTGVAERTIICNGGIMLLSSNLVIDGSSEPAPAFGVSGAKIRITTQGACLAAFYLRSVTNVAIYGLWVSDFSSVSISCIAGAVAIEKCDGLTLGAPGKGNVFTNDFYGVAPNGGYLLNDSTPNQNLVVQSNFFGIDTAGEPETVFASGFSSGVTKNITVGGSGPGEGNYIGIGGLGIGDYYNQPQYNNGYVNIINNIISVNYKKTNYVGWGEISVGGNINHRSDYSILVTGNTFGVDSGGVSLRFEHTSGNVVVENNSFGQPVVNNNIGIGMYFTDCVKKDSMIVRNNIIYGIQSGIEAENAGLTIRDNAVTCTQKGIRINVHTQGIPVISIKQILPGSIKGKTVPNGKVQIFTTDECTDLCENGKKLLANVTADNTGSFVYTGPVTGLISATVTDGFGSTSEFNGVKANLFDEYIHNATCGRKNGSITNIKIMNASSWHWEDTAGNNLGSDTNLVNLAPGKYQIILKEDNVNCQLISGYYEVGAEAKPKVDSLFNVSQPTCGQQNGSISFTGPHQPANISAWLDSAGSIIASFTPNTGTLFPGKYFYREALFDDSTCFTVLGPLVLVNQSGPSLLTNNAQITNASCSKTNGSIKNITYQNASGSIYFGWFDSTGKKAGSTIDLLNVPAGKYRLKMKDAGGCDTLTTAYFTVADNGDISYDTSKLSLNNPACKGTDGSITGITSVNATVYAWLNSNTGDTVGHIEDIQGLPEGTYTLFMTNGYGCKANTNAIALVDKKLSYDTANMIVKPSSCRGADGSISGITSINANIYTWVNTHTGATAGNAANINNVPAGSYTLTIANSNGCKITTNAITIPQQSFLTDTVTLEIVSAPNCGLNNGFIKPIQFSRDTSLYTFQWRDSAGNVLSTALNIFNLPQGYYFLYAIDSNGCSGQIFSTPIDQTGKPGFVYTGVQVHDDTCNTAKGSISTLALQDNTGIYTWAWFTGTGQPLGNNAGGLNGLKAGDYYASVTDQYNCTVKSDVLTVKNDDITPGTPQAADQYIQRGSTANIQVLSPQPGTYNLFDTSTATIPVSTSATGTFATPPVYYDKIFYIQYIQGDCASALQQVLVKVFDSTKINIPNAFSPNGDGINDTWRLSPQGLVANYKLVIFNRYGQSVYTSQDINAVWDGTMHGKPLPVGTYYYVLQYTDSFNKPAKRSGFVVIVR